MTEKRRRHEWKPPEGPWTEILFGPDICVRCGATRVLGRRAIRNGQPMPWCPGSTSELTEKVKVPK